MRAGGKMLWMMGKHFWQTTADNDHFLGGWLLLCIPTYYFCFPTFLQPDKNAFKTCQRLNYRSIHHF